LKQSCSSLKSADSLEELRKLSDHVENNDFGCDQETAWTLVLIWEIRLMVRLEMAETGNFELTWKPIASDKMSPQFIPKLYVIQTPSEGWYDFVRNEIMYDGEAERPSSYEPAEN